MNADPIIQYAVILNDDDCNRLTLVADTAADLAQQVHNTLTGWPEVKEWSERRAITENNVMRFERHRHDALPVLEAWVEGFVRYDDGTPDAGFDLDDGLLSIIPMTGAWRDLQAQWDRDCAYEGIMQARDTAAWRAAVR